LIGRARHITRAQHETGENKGFRIDIPTDDDRRQIRKKTAPPRPAGCGSEAAQQAVVTMAAVRLRIGRKSRTPRRHLDSAERLVETFLELQTSLATRPSGLPLAC